MPFELPLIKQLAKAGWKVKIWDKEGTEEPHVTIIRRTQFWRVGLRSGGLLDKGRTKEVPDGVWAAIEQNWQWLCTEWDRIHPHNPVPAAEERDDDESE